MSSKALSSPDALYHSIPQSDVVPTLSNIELDGEDEVPHQPVTVAGSHNPVDIRIRWINFMFGSAVLLPWNGTALSHKLGNRVIDTSLV